MKSNRILITGGTGLVGRALSKVLQEQGCTHVVPVGSKDFDLRSMDDARRMMQDVKPDLVFHLAARVHGLGGNTKYKSDILVENVLINTHVTECARRSGVKKFVAMGSGCVYPELKGQIEMHEHQVWDGPPHPSEDSYAHSKRLMLAQLIAAKEQYGFASAYAISGNLYGPHDNFNTEDGHVIPSLVAKFAKAAQEKTAVPVWGTGIAIRDFSFAGDAALGLVHIARDLQGAVNLGSGQRHAIKDIVDRLSELTGVTPQWSPEKPDGQAARYYDVSRLMGTGFQPKTTLRDGLAITYEWYLANQNTARH